jgi:ATP-dependent exoDNAse (exonuclease V) beta subunit
MLYFDEVTHTYRLDDQTLKSVSQIVASQFKPFNARVVAATLERTKAKDPDSPYYNMNREEIVQQWAMLGKDARESGTLMHLQIEHYYLHNHIPDLHTREWGHFADFVTDHPKWHILGCEVRVNNTKVAGTIDAIFDTPEGIVLVDWKRCKSIDYSGYSRGIHHMMFAEDCNFTRYSLQLSLYRQLVQFNVANCYIVQLHPDMNTYRKVKAQNFHMEARRLLL